MGKPHMGQIMAKCDCNHIACHMRGYCMADRIDLLEATLLTAIQREAEATVRHDAKVTALEAERDVLAEEAAGYLAAFATHHATMNGRAPNEFHPVHYDRLKELGARMDGFVRATLTQITRSKTDDQHTD